MRRRSGDHPLQERIASRIRAARMAAGLTQEALSSKLGVATRNLQRIESGAQNLTLQTIEKIAAAMGIDVTALVPIFEDRPRGAPAALHLVVSVDGRAPKPVPLFALEAAAGFARSGRVAEAIGWTLLPRKGDDRLFITQVTGRSMEPLIPDRSWSLFRGAPDVAVGKIGLFEVRRAADPEDGGAYVVKRLAARSRGRVVLASLNPDFAPLEMTDGRAAHLRAVAEWINVVAPR